MWKPFQIDIIMIRDGTILLEIYKEVIMKKRMYLVLFVFLLALLIPSKGFAEGVTVKRYFGGTRYDTAVEISKGTYEKTDSVVIAYGQDHPDALVGGTLALQIKAPILLVGKNSIPEVVINEIKRLESTEAFILGGEAAVGKAVENELMELGLNTTRIAGKNRYETAEEIQNFRYNLFSDVEGFESMGDFGFMVSGVDFADALSIAPLVGQFDTFLYLNHPNETVDSLIAVGGPSVIKHLGDTMEDYGGGSQYRIAGKNRYGTAVEVAKYFEQHMGLKLERVIIANGRNYPDALAASSLVNDGKTAILLTDPLELSPETEKYLKEKKIKDVIIVGGEFAVSTNVQNGIEGIE